MKTPVVILGGGPAGLGAAMRLARRGCFDVTVVERNERPGGNAGSFEFEGLRVDYGSHRLHPSCPQPILDDIRAMLGSDLLDRPRHGRMRVCGRWVSFPLKPADLALHLPLSFTFGVLRDAILKPRPSGVDSFETVLERGLGRTICRNFYFPYAKKIWGIAPAELDAEQARRRISAPSISKMIRKALNAVPGLRPRNAGRFYYPKRGFGQISEAYYCAALKAGASIRMGSAAVAIQAPNGAAGKVTVRFQSHTDDIPARQILSTIPISILARNLSPQPPGEALRSAAALNFRAMALIYLALDTERFTEFDAHYFPDADIPISRLSEPKNYGLATAPGLTVLCAETPCAVGDAVWTASDEALGEMTMEALRRCGLPITCRVRGVTTRRLPQAYPIYTREYREHFDAIDGWLNTLDGVVTFGRQGLFAHDNTHHTLAMAYALDECLDDDGRLDRRKWSEHRREFERHVVED